MHSPVEYIAHVAKGADAAHWKIHSLDAHLQSVAEQAAKFAEKFDSSDWAGLCGLWHDLGKFLPGWQAYIRRQTGYNEDAHIENSPSRPNHSSAGAALAMQRFNKSPLARLLSYIIAGHHAGLPDWMPASQIGGDLQSRLFDPLNSALKVHEIEQIQKIPEAQTFLDNDLPKSIPLGATNIETAQRSRQYVHLWIRMLFSCVVDADFLDTERFCTPENFHKRGGYPGLLTGIRESLFFYDRNMG